VIKKILKKTRLTDPSNIVEDLKYWLKQPAQDRVAVIEMLRNKIYGRSTRLQRVARVIQRPSR